MTLNTQRLGSLARQILAIAGILFGVLTQSDSALHLSPLVSPESSTTSRPVERTR